MDKASENGASVDNEVIMGDDSLSEFQKLKE